MIKYIKTLLLILSFNIITLSLIAQNEPTIVLIKTKFGTMRAKLYNETPKHRDNFVKLINQNFYDSTIFHRVISNFMIQGGDPNSKGATAASHLGSGGPGYTIPAEFNDKFFHKKGAICAARTGNPQKASSGSQFYIVQGTIISDNQFLNQEKNINQSRINKFYPNFIKRPENAKYRNIIGTAQQNNDKKTLDSLSNVLVKVMEKDPKFDKYTYPTEKRKAYTTIGGSPHLDGEYTVFGEVIEGLDIIDKIAAVKKNAADRPEEDIKITIEIEK